MAGLDKDLTDSFQAIENFHIKFITPKICEVIKSTNVSSLAFSEGIEPGHTCLNEILTTQPSHQEFGFKVSFIGSGEFESDYTTN